MKAVKAREERIMKAREERIMKAGEERIMKVREERIGEVGKGELMRRKQQEGGRILSGVFVKFTLDSMTPT